MAHPEAVCRALALITSRFLSSLRFFAPTATHDATAWRRKGAMPAASTRVGSPAWDFGTYGEGVRAAVAGAILVGGRRCIALLACISAPQALVSSPLAWVVFVRPSISNFRITAGAGLLRIEARAAVRRSSLGPERGEGEGVCHLRYPTRSYVQSYSSSTDRSRSRYPDTVDTMRRWH